jgi:integrase
MAKRTTPGIRRTHSSGCPARGDREGRCDCNAGYEADVWDPASRRKIRKTFASAAEAKAWQTDARSGVRRGTIRAAEPRTVREAAADLVGGMRSGAVRTRSGDRYKPSVVRGYDEALRLYVVEPLGAMRLGDVQRRHVQRLVDGLVADDAAPSTVRNAVMPLRVIYRRAIRDGLVAVNPCEHLDLPAVRGRRDRIVSPIDAARLVAALSVPRDRAIWATALYAGLRRGELMGLRWRDCDLAGGSICVERSLDPKAGVYVEPKSRAGRRRVPMTGALRDALLDHRAMVGEAEADALVFAEPEGSPFAYRAALGRALRAWKAAGLEPVGLHEARHTCASVMIAAGVNIKALSEFLGHSSITVTLDRYGHLLPGSIDEAARLLDAFLASAVADAARSETAEVEAAAEG